MIENCEVIKIEVSLVAHCTLFFQHLVELYIVKVDRSTAREPSQLLSN